MLSSSLDTLLKVSKTRSHQKLFAYDCLTLYFASLEEFGLRTKKQIYKVLTKVFIEEKTQSEKTQS